MKSELKIELKVSRFENSLRSNIRFSTYCSELLMVLIDLSFKLVKFFKKEGTKIFIQHTSDGKTNLCSEPKNPATSGILILNNNKKRPAIARRF